MSDASRLPVTATLGRFAAEVPIDELPNAVVDRATMVLVDTIGCMVGGWSTEVTEPLERYLAGRSTDGAGLIVGSTSTASGEIAAMVNGTVGHALDYDDLVRAMPGHPSVAVLAALIAEAGLRPITLSELLGAYVIGVDVAVAIGRGLGGGHSRGWHPTAICTGFGAAAALARVRGLDADATTRALGMVGSVTSGLKHSFGTMTKPFHAGWSAHQATVAVDLAAAGFTSATDIVEAPGGFLETFGDERSDPARIIDRLGSPWVFQAPGVGIKVFPCCGAGHRAIDAALQIVEESGITAEEIASVSCRTPPGVLAVMAYDRPTNGLEAKFSLGYVVACALADRAVTFESFTEDAIVRPAILELLGRTTVVEDPACFPPHPPDDPDLPPYDGFDEVVVERVNGERYVATAEQAPGAPGRSLSWEHVATKFIDCAREARCTVAKAEDALERLRDVGSSRPFAEAIAPLATRS